MDKINSGNFDFTDLNISASKTIENISPENVYDNRVSVKNNEIETLDFDDVNTSETRGTIEIVKDDFREIVGTVQERFEEASKLNAKNKNSSPTMLSYIDKLSNYERFLSCLEEKFTEIPIGDSTYVPQGICEVDGYKLVTAYDSTGENNTIIYVSDQNGNYIKSVQLDNKVHAGSVSYDAQTGSIYITGSGNGNCSEVLKYTKEDFLTCSEGEILYENSKFTIDDNCDLYSSSAKQSSPAYLTISNGYLYVGNFVKDSDIDHSGVIKRYKLDENGNVDIASCQNIENPYSETQGMCVYNKDGKDYYIFSRSYGRGNDSKLVVATMDEYGNFNTERSMDLPCMSEQISVNQDGGISIVFESGASEYSDASTNISHACTMNFDAILNGTDINMV